jgi:hypothetical protein
MTAGLGALIFVIALFVAALLLGLAGRRWRYVRLVLVGIGPVYSVAVLVYSLVEGSTSICTGSGGTFRCTEVTYASTWGFGGSVAVGVVVILTMAPLVSAWLGSRIPAVAAVIALPIVMIFFTTELAAWTPAWAAIVAAAIAGPPSGGREVKGPGAL